MGDTTEEDAWKKINQLWCQQGFKKDETVSFARAKEFILKYMTDIEKLNTVDDGVLTELFEEIDTEDDQIDLE